MQEFVWICLPALPFSGRRHKKSADCRPPSLIPRPLIFHPPGAVSPGPLHPTSNLQAPFPQRRRPEPDTPLRLAARFRKRTGTSLRLRANFLRPEELYIRLRASGGTPSSSSAPATARAGMSPLPSGGARENSCRSTTCPSTVTSSR